MQKPQTAGLMKIGELAKATGASPSTIKYYVSQGLVDVALKTSSNMAYYHPSCVRRIELIKSLQKEKYYPLAVIKELIKKGDPAPEIALMDAISRLDNQQGGGVAFSQAPQATGLTRRQINELVKAGLIVPTLSGRSKHFDKSSLAIMGIVKERLNAGLPFEFTLASFSAFQSGMEQAVPKDVDAMFQQAMLNHEHDPNRLTALISFSDKTLDQFILLKWRMLNKIYNIRQIQRVAAFAAALEALLIVPGHPELSYLPSCAASGVFAQAAEVIRQTITLKEFSIERATKICGNGISLFLKLDLRQESDDDRRVYLAAARASYLCLAPNILGCRDAARHALADLPSLPHGHHLWPWLSALEGQLRREMAKEQ